MTELVPVWIFRSCASRRRNAREKKRLASATSVADEAELEESREAAEAAAVRPSLAPQVQFDPDTGRIIIDEGTLTHVRCARLTRTIARTVFFSPRPPRVPSQKCIALTTRRCVLLNWTPVKIRLTVLRERSGDR